jgi:ribonuclease-3
LAEVDTEALAARIGHRFADESLLQLALRHRSWCAENGGVESNERLEFLGDSVLGVVVTDRLFHAMPGVPEGVLARLRAELVNWRTLSAVARTVDLGPSILLGRGEQATGGADKSSILADALEAIFGAVYLDAGLDAARRVILHLLADTLEVVETGEFSDFKSRLQELAAVLGIGPPSYRVSESGPDHSKEFTAEVSLSDGTGGTGHGRSKKEAEQAAAEMAWRHLAAARLDDEGRPENGAHDG